MTLLRWLRAHPYVVMLIGWIAFALLAWRGFHREPNVVVDEHATETAEAKTVEVFTDRWNAVMRRDTEATHDAVTVRHRTRTVEPSGRTQESETEVTATSDTLRDAVAAAGQGEATAAKVETVYVDRVVDRRVEVSTPLPDWRVGGMVGYSGGMLYGGQVERRVLGPVSVGAWLVTGTQTVGGLSAGLEF